MLNLQLLTGTKRQFLHKDCKFILTLSAKNAQYVLLLYYLGKIFEELLK